MARVAGVDLPPNKRAEIGLTYIYGIGRSRSNSVLKEAGVNLDTRVRDLSEDELSRIRAILGCGIAVRFPCVDSALIQTLVRAKVRVARPSPRRRRRARSSF